MTCDADSPALEWPDAKDPNDALDYAVQFEKECARQWEANKDFTSGQRIRIFGRGQASGLEFDPTTPGRSGSSQPRWPTIAGATVNDGSIVWTARAISSASLYRTISGIPTWTPATTGITVANTSVTDTTAMADLSDGIDGYDYAILVKATFSDSKTRTAVCILKVRRAERVCEG